jgi:hypothetical protein
MNVSKADSRNPRPAHFSRTHLADCPRCRAPFDLLAACWCDCRRGHPSKICPSCRQCLCSHPDYGRPSSWLEAPAALRLAGFEKLFIYYL